jgi:hypothetical protein
MPTKYENCLPNFSGNDVANAAKHMSNFWDFFQLNTIDDDAKDLVIKIFSSTLHDTARRWYYSIPDKSIKTMDQL